MKKQFLCIENGEFFIVEAINLQDAKKKASLWGGSAVRELTEEEIKTGNIPEMIADQE